MWFKTVFILLLTTINNAYGFFDINFVKNYFQLKSINMLTFFTCNDDLNHVSLTKYFMTHGFRVSFQNMDRYNVFDFDYIRMDYTHEGIVADPTCNSIQNLIKRAGILYQFTDLQYWLFIQTNLYANSLTSINSSTDVCKEQLSNLGYELLSNADIYPDSQVVWAQNPSCRLFEDSLPNLYALFDVYRISSTTEVRSSFIGWYPGNELVETFSNLPSIGERRRNFHQTLLRGGYVIQFKKNFTYLLDLHKRGIESFLKRSYPMMVILKEDLNFRANFSITDSFGWDKNNSGIFDGGLMGQFQTKQIDFAMQEILMRKDRLAVCDFSAELVQVTARVIFRQPPLSSISNIYLLPFNESVWISCGGVILIIAVMIVFQIRITRNADEIIKHINSFDLITFISGAICQQGFSLSPSTLSARFTMLVLFVASLFLFTSYSASIVALLQTPSTAIQTLTDLVASPLGVGIQNITYNVVFIKESQHPITKKLYEQKVLPKGRHGFLSVVEGIEKVRKGMYAFQVDTGAAYDVISATFTEDEKCGLDEIELYQLPMQAVALANRSPYRDLFTIRLRWQREIGLQDRISKIWVPQKPKCESSRGGFVSVGLTEFAPTIKAFLFGALFGFVLFLFELILKNYQIVFKYFNFLHAKKTFHKFF